MQQNTTFSTADNLKVLGFNYKPTDEELKKRWRQLAKRFHPDRLSKLDYEEKKRRENKFKDISRAYQELINNKQYNTQRKINLQDTFADILESFLNDVFIPNEEIVNCMIVNYYNNKYSFSLNKATEELEVKITEPLESFLNHKTKIYVIKHNGSEKEIKVKLNTHNYSARTIILMGSKDQFIDTIVDESYPIYTILNIGLE
jgi:predicted transcriptional regulator